MVDLLWYSTGMILEGS